MKTVLLAGGFGSRISEESVFKPKPMIEIGGMPILWHIMKEYAFYGHNDFIICAGYKQEYIKEWFANYFLPGAQPDLTNAVVNCAKWSGNITGILGWYCDNASSTYAGGLKNLTGKEWSLTPRGIPGIGIADIDMNKYQADKFSPAVDSTWTPVEFDPEEYKYYKLQ